MVVVTLFNELVYVFSVNVPETKHIIYETLESDRFVPSLLRISVSIFSMKMLAKANAILVPMAVPVCLKVVAFHELE